MLPTPTDNGARLAAILPTAIASIASRQGIDGVQLLQEAGILRGSRAEHAVSDEDRSAAPAEGWLAASVEGRPAAPAEGWLAASVEGRPAASAEGRLAASAEGRLAASAEGRLPVFAEGRLPAIDSIVLVVVDGLGHANLRAAAGHARTLSALPTRRIETVIPSTTGAALTTLTTGTLPGEHGLIGYRIRHPRLGLVTTLRDWDGIEDHRAWQRATPLFGLAARLGARAVAIGRPAHAGGGLTEAILTGTEYHGGQTIAERFDIAARLARGSDPLLAYLYVDELDKAAHRDGWRSDRWLQRLEQLDEALRGLLRALPGNVGVIVTADHGMVDVPAERRLLLDTLVPMDGVELVGGEPRMRSLYLREGVVAAELAAEVQRALGKLAWVGTREEAIAAGCFGPIGEQVAQRLGEVLVAARGEVAFMVTSEDPAVLEMVGQHGSLSDEERGIPLALGGALEGTGFAGAVADLAAARSDG